MARKLLIVQVAALGYPAHEPREGLDWLGLLFRPTQTVFPAVTCTVQASFRTASAPAQHGMIANGVFNRQFSRPMFWEQSAGLVQGPRIWHDFRRRGRSVGMLFWQQSMGELADVLLTPAPIHKHHGGMIEDCYAKPAGLYEKLCKAVGRPFKLRHYWGPLASPQAGDWIAKATAALLADRDLAPDLCLTYLPTLDYDLQRNDPRSFGAGNSALKATVGKQLDGLLAAARANSYDVVVFGDYQIAPVSGAAFPNRALLAAGLMAVRPVRKMLYPDLHTSKAFAMVDHEIAHVYVKDSADLPAVRAVLEKTPGVDQVLDRAAQHALGIDHANSGELVIVAQEGKWFAYPWWNDKHQAPDYASHVDIHNKPGYDPCELFCEKFGWPPLSVSQNTARVRGSHGRNGAGREVAWASTLELGRPQTLIELAQAVRSWLNEEA